MEKTIGTKEILAIGIKMAQKSVPMQEKKTMSQADLDEAAQRLSEAEQRYLLAHGWIPVVSDDDQGPMWRPPGTNDLIEQDVAISSQKRWLTV